MGSTPAQVVAQFGSPLYVYEEREIRARCRAISGFGRRLSADVHYAMKANSNPEILAIILAEGLGIDAVSLGEARLAVACGCPPAKITYNGNNVDDDEMRAVRALGVHLSVDSLSQLERYGKLFPGTSVGVRLNPDIGAGHHGHVVTGGTESKFGIDVAEWQDILVIARRHGLVIDGLQQHIGSGILDAGVFLSAMEVLLETARPFPDLRFVDFGGGFGVPYRRSDAELDLDGLASRAEPLLEKFRAKQRPEFRFRFEPGRYVVATSGTLLVTVTAVKRSQRHVFAGTDSGFHHLIRPMAYGSHHEIENLSRPDARKEPVCVAGNICESGDLFAKDRMMPSPEEGDLLAIRTAGAYGYSMASTYNLRPRPAEVLLSDGNPRLIRRRETLEDLLPR